MDDLLDRGAPMIQVTSQSQQGVMEGHFAGELDAMFGPRA